MVEVPGVPGPTVVVDYAHTPDAVGRALEAVRPACRGALWIVLGCGGDRDPSKRAPMGRIAAATADHMIATSDNPRTEQPAAIVAQMLTGVAPEHRPRVLEVVDRAAAIAHAIAAADAGDLVLIAGKGHEDYQILGTTKVHFDDREEAAAAVALRPRFHAQTIAAATGGTASAEAVCARVVIDSRIVAPGDLYVAIAGERVDGHGFCAAPVASATSWRWAPSATTGMPSAPSRAPTSAWAAACLLYTSPSPRDRTRSRMPSSA